MNLADSVAGLRVGGGGDGASVDDDEFSFMSTRGGNTTSIKKLALDGCTVRLSGTTTELFDIEGGHDPSRDKEKSNTETAENTESTKKCGMKTS